MKKPFRDFNEIAQWAIANLSTEKIEAIVDAGDGDLQVDIKINGVAVDFETIMTSLENQYEAAVKQEAEGQLSKVVKDKIADIQDILYNIENQAECLQQDLESDVGF